jgi:hypothetical protein
MFPSVRLSGAAVEAFVERAVLEHAGDGYLSETLIDEGLALVDGEERRRVVELWAEPYADRWASLTHASGDVDAAEQALVVGALRAAIAERQPTPRELAEPLDRGRLRRSPFAALAVVLPPAFVWSADEARAAKVAASQRRGRARMDVVEGVAYALMTFTHVRAYERPGGEARRRAALRRTAARFGDAFRGVRRGAGEHRRGADGDGGTARCVRRAASVACVAYVYAARPSAPASARR